MFDTHTDKFFADMTNTYVEGAISHMEEVERETEANVPAEFEDMCYEEVILYLREEAERAVGF